MLDALKRLLGQAGDAIVPPSIQDAAVNGRFGKGNPIWGDKGKAKPKPQYFEDGSMLSSNGMKVGMAQPQQSLSVQPTGISPLRNGTEWQGGANPQQGGLQRRGWKNQNPQGAVARFNHYQAQQLQPQQLDPRYGSMGATYGAYGPTPMQGGFADGASINQDPYENLLRLIVR